MSLSYIGGRSEITLRSAQRRAFSRVLFLETTTIVPGRGVDWFSLILLWRSRLLTSSMSLWIGWFIRQRSKAEAQAVSDWRWFSVSSMTSVKHCFQSCLPCMACIPCNCWEAERWGYIVAPTGGSWYKSPTKIMWRPPKLVGFNFNFCSRLSRISNNSPVWSYWFHPQWRHQLQTMRWCAG